MLAIEFIFCVVYFNCFLDKISIQEIEFSRVKKTQTKQQMKTQKGNDKRQKKRDKDIDKE